MKKLIRAVPVGNQERIREAEDIDTMVRIVNRFQNEAKEQKAREQRRQKEVFCRRVKMAFDAAVLVFSIIGFAAVIAVILM